MATVLIWNNNVVTGFLPGQHRYSGHAALSIDDSWATGGSSIDNYVSFWPAGGAGSRTAQITGVPSRAQETIIKDLEAEHYAPDHVIRVSGLNEAKMRGEWNKLRTDAAQYKFFRNSCSTVAARVLKAGTSAKTPSHVIWSPLEVKRLALGMGGSPISWTLLLREMQLQGLISVDEEKMLSTLGKRDERHGSSTKTAYFARGKRIAEKAFMGKRGDYRIEAGGTMAAGQTYSGSEVSTANVLMTGTVQMMPGAYGNTYDRSWDRS